MKLLRSRRNLTSIIFIIAKEADRALAIGEFCLDRAPFVCCVDSDVVLDPSWLQEMLKLINFPLVGAAQGALCQSKGEVLLIVI